MKVYQAIARSFRAWQTTDEDRPWHDLHRERVRELLRENMPSGAGWDSGTSLDLMKSKPDRLVFYGSFHHMTEDGMYDGWTDHEVWVRPSLAWGIEIDVKGRNREGIKDYIHDLFYDALWAEVDDNG